MAKEIDMVVKTLRPCKLNGKPVERGKEVDLPNDLAKAWIKNKVAADPASLAEEKKQKPVPPKPDRTANKKPESERGN